MIFGPWYGFHFCLWYLPASKVYKTTNVGGAKKQWLIHHFRRRVEHENATQQSCVPQKKWCGFLLCY
jgi:hypothetical protein